MRDECVPIVESDTQYFDDAGPLPDASYTVTIVLFSVAVCVVVCCTALMRAGAAEEEGNTKRVSPEVTPAAPVRVRPE